MHGFRRADRNCLILCRKSILISIWRSTDSLAAVICIEDPLREEAPEVIRALHEAGLNKIVMMTGRQ